MFAKPYAEPDGEWERLGVSPLEGVSLPFVPHRFRVVLPGYAPLEAAFVPQSLPVLPLVPEKDAKPGMVFVPAGTSTHADAPTVDLPAYWLDRHELTNFGDSLHAFDRLVLVAFVVELLLRFFVYRGRFFRDPWRVFDFVVVGIAVVPAGSAFAVLRALRVLRVLRLVSLVPSMRRVIGALLKALPGMVSIVGLLGLVLYVFAVMASKLYGAIATEFFGPTRGGRRSGRPRRSGSSRRARI